MKLPLILLAALWTLGPPWGAPAFGADGTGPAPPAEQAAAEPQPSWPWQAGRELRFSGTVTERYRARFTEGDSDGDLESLADLSVDDLFGGKVGIHLNAGLFLDTIGRVHSHRDNCGSCHAPKDLYFTDVYDAYDAPAQGRIYTLYAEIRDIVEDLAVRVGRHCLSKGESVHLDGVSASYKPSPFAEITLGAGLPVYTDSPHIVSNFLGAAYLELHPGAVIDGLPARASKITFEFLHAEEGKEGVRDDYGAVHLWQRFFGGAASVYLKAGVLNGKLRETRAALVAHCPTTGLQLKARYVRSPSPWGRTEDGETESLTHDHSPFLAVMGVFEPYQQFDVALYEEFCPHFGLEAGVALRDTLADRYASAYNHDFDRFHASAFAYDLFLEGLDASLTAEVYSSDGPTERENLLTWGFDASWRASKRVELRLGSHFQKHRVVFDPDAPTRLSETTDVRLVSLGARYALREDLDLGLRYEIESDAGDFEKLFHTIEVRVTWRL